MSIFSLACQLCKWGVDENLAMEYFVDGWESESMTENEIIVHNFQIRKNDNKLRQISDGMAYIGEEDDPSDVAIIPKSSIIALVKF